jgi:hypothetical protein
MHKRLVAVGLAAILTAFSTAVARAQPPSPAQDSGTLRIFLDCNWCEDDFLRTEITFVDYVRDRKDADVHVLVTTQGTGSGGTEYTLKFIGLRRFAAVEQTMRHIVLQTATSDERRRGVAEALKLGLVRYASDTPLASKLKVTFDAGGAQKSQADPKKDPWNLWAYRVNFGGSFDGEQSSSGGSVRASVSANRTTDAWKLQFNANGNFRENRFDLGDGETFTSTSRNISANALIVKSLTGHWSAGLLVNTSVSTFLNYDLRARIAPGVEYDIFPYAQSTRRMLTLQYSVGLIANDYIEETIFDKTSERLVDHRLITQLSMRQPWGTAFGSVNFSQYLTHPDKYSVSGFGFVDVRLFKGFSFNVFTDIARTRDQIYLQRGQASTEEILVRQRQLATGYRYSINFGISYSFGSIFNNIVNPRFSDDF